MTKRTVFATAAAIFAAGSFATAAHADGVKCSGANSCNSELIDVLATRVVGMQVRPTASGWTETTDVASCTAQGGKVL